MARFPYWIVLDTGMLRETVKGSARAMDFGRLSRLRGQTPVSLSQAAYLEFTNQLLSGHVTFEKWQAIVPSIEAVLDPVHPIIPSGISLRVMLGVATAGADQDAVRSRV